MAPPEYVSTEPCPVHSLPRSNRPIVRNWMLDLPEVQAIGDLPIEAREALRDALQALSRASRERGNEAWRRHKAPMAAYWKAKAVDARHLALAIPKGLPPKTPSQMNPIEPRSAEGVLK